MKWILLILIGLSRAALAAGFEITLNDGEAKLVYQLTEKKPATLLVKDNSSPAKQVEVSDKNAGYLAKKADSYFKESSHDLTLCPRQHAVFSRLDHKRVSIACLDSKTKHTANARQIINLVEMLTHVSR